jgi:hypothetical protein
MTRHSFLILLFLPALGCGGPAPEEGSSSTPLAYQPCDVGKRVGQFTVALEKDFTGVQGRVLGGVVPANIPEVKAQEGGCRLLRGRNLFCNPPCGAGQTCGESLACIPYPTAQSVGTVQVRGLKTSLSLSPTSANFYSNGATPLPHPGFDEGAAIRLEAGGGMLAGFALQGRGIRALTFAAGDLPVERGKPVALSWTPPPAPGSARLRAVVDLAHHGGISATIECDGIPDTGSFAIPAGLVAQLLDIGVAGFPKAVITRRTADSASITAGCVELLVQSEVTREIAIPGLKSCSTDQDCPMGQKCQMDLTCK